MQATLWRWSPALESGALSSGLDARPELGDSVELRRPERNGADDARAALPIDRTSKVLATPPNSQQPKAMPRLKKGNWVRE
jgi:hypothetical protein